MQYSKHDLTTSIAVALATLVLGAGCNGALDDNQNNQNQGPQGPDDEKASFVIGSSISGEDSNTTYVRYLDELDLGEISLDDAREYSGYATIGGVGDMFFVAEGNAPKMTRFSVSSEGELNQNGEISFSQYVDEAPLYGNTFINESKAYLHNGDTGRIIWNPEELTIESTNQFDQIESERNDFTAYQGFRRATVVRGDHVFMPFNWTDADFYNYLDTSKILVIDAENDEVVNTIEAPCPGLGVGTKDDEGNVYFTNWVSTSAAPVIDGEEATHSPCAVRIDAGETSLNEDWTRDLEEMTDGREVNAMRILEGSTALAAVLDEERVDPDSETKAREISYANNWELWRLDLEEGTGSKVPNTGYIAGGFYAFDVDGRMVVTLPNGDYSQTTAYEIPVEGEAEELFTVEGWVYQLVALEQ